MELTVVMEAGVELTVVIEAGVELTVALLNRLQSVHECILPPSLPPPLPAPHHHPLAEELVTNAIVYQCM